MLGEHDPRAEDEITEVTEENEKLRALIAAVGLASGMTLTTAMHECTALAKEWASNAN